MFWVRNHMDDWVDLHKPRGGMFRSNCSHGFDRRAHQLSFELESAPLHERVHRAFIAPCPRKKGNLVHGHKVTWPVNLVREPICESDPEACETFDEFRLEHIEVLGPAEMAQVPNHLCFSFPRGLDNGQHARKIISAASCLHQMPSHTFARYVQALMLE